MSERFAKGADVVVFGSPVVDDLRFIDAGFFEAFANGTTPVSVRGRTIMRVGGKATNTALLLQRLGHRVELVGKVGDDAGAGICRDSLIESGVSDAFLVADPDKGTGRVLVIAERDRLDVDPYVVISSNTANDDSPQAIDEYFAVWDRRQADRPQLGYLTLEHSQDLTRRLAEAVLHKGLQLMCDVSAFGQDPKDYLKLMQYFHVVAPNHIEAELVTGCEITDSKSAREVAKIFRENGALEVMITRGADGIYYQNSDGAEIEVPGIFVPDPQGTTGAGDTARAYFASSRLRGEDIDISLQRANQAGAFLVAHGYTPALSELDAWAVGDE